MRLLAGSSQAAQKHRRRLRISALRHHVAIDIEPSPTFANETTALMLANGSSIADTRTGDELHFGRIIACNTRIDNPKSQPFLIPVEWDRSRSGTRMPRREQIWLIAQNEGAVAGSHQRLRVGGNAPGVQRTTALRIRVGRTARTRILDRRIHRTPSLIITTEAPILISAGNPRRNSPRP
jgi:hypothetical protein